MDHSELIGLLGGVSEVASLVGVKMPSVSGWKRNGIPENRLVRLAVIAEQRGVSSRVELFPDSWQFFWPELKQHPNAPAAGAQTNEQAAIVALGL